MVDPWQASAAERAKMVHTQIEARGIRNPAVLAAFRAVPREAFVPDELKVMAYSDLALPIIEGQTISQPYMVAIMLEALAPGPESKILEVGTGSGYAAALLSRMAAEIYTVERHAALVQYAGERMRALGYSNVHILHGDGTLGWPEHAPYDGILVSAGGPSVPGSLLAQLTVGGKLLIPVGVTGEQTLIRITRRNDRDYAEADLGPVAFVPLIGEEGWSPGE